MVWCCSDAEMVKLLEKALDRDLSLWSQKMDLEAERKINLTRRDTNW